MDLDDAAGPVPLHVAVVGAADGVRMVAVAYSLDDLLRRLADYVTRRLRMENARRLLRETDLTVSEIAAATGHASAAQFGQAFRRATGCAPTMVSVENAAERPFGRGPMN